MFFPYGTDGQVLLAWKTHQQMSHEIPDWSLDESDLLAHILVTEEKRPAQALKVLAKLDPASLNEVFGSWKQAQKVHFDDGGTFDKIYQPK